MNKDLDINNYVDIDYLKKMCKTFCELTGVNVNIINLNRIKNELLFNDEISTEFCSKCIKKSPKGLQKCKECIDGHITKMIETKSVCKMRCHTGLVDYALPIYINETPIAYLVFGEALDKPHDIVKAKKNAKELQIDEQTYLEYYKKVNYIPTEKWEKLLKYLNMAANLISQVATKNYKIAVNKNKDSILRFVIEAITESFEFNEILSIVCIELLKLFNVDRVFVFKFYKKDGEYKILKDENKNKDAKLIKDYIDTNELKKLCLYWKNEITKNGGKEIKVIDNFNKNIPENIKEIHKKCHLLSCLGKVIAEDEESWTILAIQDYSESFKWDESDFDFLNIISKHITIALKQSELYNKILKRSEIGKRLINNLPFSVWLKDKFGRYQIVNNAYCILNNFKTPNDVIGKTDYEIFPQNVADRYK